MAMNDNGGVILIIESVDNDKKTKVMMGDVASLMTEIEVIIIGTKWWGGQKECWWWKLEWI